MKDLAWDQEASGLPPCLALDSVIPDAFRHTLACPASHSWLLPCTPAPSPCSPTWAHPA